MREHASCTAHNLTLVLLSAGLTPSFRRVASARWRLAVGGVALCVVVMCVLATTLQEGRLHEMSRVGLVSRPDGFGGGASMLTGHYNKELRQSDFCISFPPDEGVPCHRAMSPRPRPCPHPPLCSPPLFNPQKAFGARWAREQAIGTQREPNQ